jgi:hypothetical protein
MFNWQKCGSGCSLRQGCQINLNLETKKPDKTPVRMLTVPSQNHTCKSLKQNYLFNDTSSYWSYSIGCEQELSAINMANLYCVTGGQAILDNSFSTAPTRRLLRISRKYHIHYSFYHLRIFNYDICGKYPFTWSTDQPKILTVYQPKY